MMDAIAALSDHAARTRYEDLPADAVAAAKTFIVDSIGVGVAGSAGPWVDEIAACLAGWGVAPESRVWVRGAKVPAPAAALANAYHMHNSEFDCVHEPAVVHTMTAVLPAALAQAERQGGVSGEELIAAVVTGVDVACRIGASSRAPLKFFRPGTAGGFGATAAVGKLMGFDGPSMARAMGLVYGQMCGTMQPHTESSILLGLQIGFNARNALVAADLAARGIPSIEHVLEGPFGYYRLFEGEYDPSAITDALGRRWSITQVSHKPFPSGRATHGIVDGLLEIRRRDAPPPEAIGRVVASVPPLVRHLVGRALPASPEPGTARLCAAFVGARVLIRGALDLTDFRPPALTDPATHALAGRFQIQTDDNPDPNALAPVAVSVFLGDGRRRDARVEHMYGSPGKPMSRDAHLEKFRRNWVSGARPLAESDGERLIRLVDRLESVRDVGELVDLACAGPR